MNNDKRVKVIGKLITKCDNLTRQRDDLNDYITKGKHQHGNKYDDYQALDTYNDILEEIKDLKEEIDLLAEDYESNSKNNPFSRQNLFKLVNDINQVYMKSNNIVEKLDNVGGDKDE